VEPDLPNQHNNTPTSHNTTYETLRDRTGGEDGENTSNLAETNISVLDTTTEPDPPDLHQHNNTPVSNSTAFESLENSRDWTGGGDEEDVTDPTEMNTLALSANHYIWK
jgi:hypothetical protein